MDVENLAGCRFNCSIGIIWMEWELLDICLHFLMSVKALIMLVAFLYYFFVMGGVRG